MGMENKRSMDAPASKTDLLQSMEDGRREWEALLTQIGEQSMLEPGVEGVWSVKDIIVHIAGFEQYAVALLTDVLRADALAQAALDEFYQQQLDHYRAQHADFPAQLDALDGDQTNTLFIAVRDQDTVHDVLQFEQQIYQQLLEATRALSETDLTDPDRAGGRTLLEILPNQSYGHYRMHIPAVRRWLDQRNRSG